MVCHRNKSSLKRTGHWSLVPWLPVLERGVQVCVAEVQDTSGYVQSVHPLLTPIQTSIFPFLPSSPSSPSLFDCALSLSIYILLDRNRTRFFPLLTIIECILYCRLPVFIAAPSIGFRESTGSIYH